MQDKPYIMMVYALFGLLIALYPSLARERVDSALNVQGRLSKFPAQWLWKSIGLAISSVVMIVVLRESSSMVLLASFGLIAVASSLAIGKLDAMAILPNFFGLCVSTGILWWCRPFNFTGIELLAFGLITFAIMVVFTDKEPLCERGFSFKWLLLYAPLAAVLCFSTGILFLGDHVAIPSLWHHWGAYIGPAQLLLSGAAVFHDFPVQYGFGPTALIASVCSNDCWQGMYYLTGFITFAFFMLISVLALALTRRHWPAERLVVLALCLVACFFWTSYPPLATSPILTPSVSGFRYLPATLMITYLFFTEKIEFSTFRMGIAHGLWVFGVLWSPESAFYVTSVWWPYYIFIRRGEGSLVSRLKALLNALLILLLIAAGLWIIITGIYHLSYHKAPTLYGFFAYIINPPLPVPIDPHGAVWYFIVAVAIEVMSLFYLWRKSGDSLLFRHGFLVLLLCFSVFSYYLGRSLDNNMFNIMPFILLLLLHAITTASEKNLTKISVVLVAALVGWLPVFRLYLWHDNVNQGKILSFEPKLLRDAISLSNPLTASKLIQYNGLAVSAISDAIQAIDFIHQHYGEPVTVLDSPLVLTAAAVSEVWSAINNPANYGGIPSIHRREFLSATAASLNRPGWLIVYQSYPADEWLADFDSVYERTNRLEFGTYYAIRYTPKKAEG